MKNYIDRAKYVFRNAAKNYKKIIFSLFAFLGALLTVAECIKIMFNTNMVYELMNTYCTWILIVGLFVSFMLNRIQLKYEYFINDTDMKITLQVADILRVESNAFVIPTNSTFDTTMENEFISINNVQGKIQNEYFNDNIKTLDHLIEMGLTNVTYKTVDKGVGKKKRYPIGTVSKVDYNGRRFYFTAIADINQYGKPINTKVDNIYLALEGLWKELETKGHIEDIAIPLLGTGKAGIKDATRERVVKEIIFSFIACAKERKVTEKIIIFIHPKDLESKQLNLIELDEYLQYMCKYRYTNAERESEGTAV